MKELSDQTRIVVASALSLLVIILWGLFYRPAPPARPVAPETGTSAAAPASPGADSLSAASAAAPARSASAIADTTEKTLVVESDLYRVVLSNRGAVVRGWQLKKYTDADRNPLNLVNTAAGEQTGNWPFLLQIPGDPQLEDAASRALYTVTASPAGSGSVVQAPATIEFKWSDGQTTIIKRLKFAPSYELQFESSVQRNGQFVPHRLAWRGGIGDFAVPPAARGMNAFTDSAGAIRTISPNNLGQSGNRTTPAEIPGNFEAVGLEDHYFAAAFLPPLAQPGQPVPATMTLSGRQLARNTVVDGKTQPEILPEVAAGMTTPDPLNLRVFVGPKDLDVLKNVQPPLDGLVQFGWLGFIAAPLFYVLRWMHGFIPNYGWAIVILTVAINMLLYPLTLKSWRSMQKMQRVAPEIRSIQDRYKKYSLRDPRKQEMNKEVMAVYAREGINPMGSCLPTLVQFPIWYGVNRMLTATIELRHAPWFGWIKDLSARDPYYILPVAMVILMYVQQKMMPMTATDPSQQRMMNMMPLMMGAMFIFLPLSSGLYLYILTSSVIGVLQRLHLNRAAPIKASARRRRS